MIVATPEILWHGGANESGKPDPVFSVDMHPSGIFATAGVDDHLPPKGTVRVSNLHMFISLSLSSFNINFIFCCICLVMDVRSCNKQS